MQFQQETLVRSSLALFFLKLFFTTKSTKVTKIVEDKAFWSLSLSFFVFFVFFVVCFSD